MSIIGKTTKRLTPISTGVAHSSARRTRLKVPKNHHLTGSEGVSGESIKDALELVPGVKSVRLVAPIGSVVVEHDDRPDVLEEIGKAIEKASPALFKLLTEEAAEPELAVFSLFSNLFADDSKKSASARGEVIAENIAADEASSQTLKKALPFAFLAAGLMQILEGEALLAGVGPLALFYWAFDSRWKFKQEQMAKQSIAWEDSQGQNNQSLPKKNETKAN
jgi:hypothetical protein